MGEEIVEAHLVFKGDVQGVGFRYTAKMLADSLGLKGIVRNLSDGSVELVAQGTKQTIESFISRLEKELFLGNISEIQKAYKKPSNNYISFSISH